jgi:hypothetical protein
MVMLFSSLQGSNKLSQKLLLSLNESGLIHMVPSMVNDIYLIRFAVCAKYASEDDMRVAYNTIHEHATLVLAEHRAQRTGRQMSITDSLDFGGKETASQYDPVVPDDSNQPKDMTEGSVHPVNKSRVSDER